MSVELILFGAGGGEVALIMRRYHASIDRPRTRDFWKRMLAFKDFPPKPLNWKLAVQLARAASVTPTKPDASRPRSRFRASPCIDLIGSFEANQNSKNPNDPLVSCIDAERAAT